METLLRKSDFYAAALLIAIAGSYLGWELIGLRYTNHDDIYFGLYSHVAKGHYWDFSNYVALKQARIQAYLNMPVFLWANSEAGSPAYDFVNIGSFALCYCCFIALLAKLGGVRNALAVSSCTLLLFPLHYFFSFPQGFPVVYSLELAAGLYSACLFSTFLETGNRLSLCASAAIFTLSLTGPEYNFVLHSLFLIIAFLARNRDRLTPTRLVALPYVIGILLILGAYLLFSWIARGAGANADGRVSVGLDPSGFVRAFGILAGNAFLPVALWRGLTLDSFTEQGMPTVPQSITYGSLWSYNPDLPSLVIVGLAGTVLFGIALAFCRLSLKQALAYLAVFASLITVPGGVVCLSAHYQSIVAHGYLQGHLLTCYVAIGSAAMLFVFLSVLIDRCGAGPTRGVAIVCGGLMLAGLFVATFAYNILNRQVMIANAQKWGAVESLAAYIRTSRPDLAERELFAPELWMTNGVSSIPDSALLSTYLLAGSNYWSAYCAAVLHFPLKIRDASEAIQPGDAIVTFSANPSGVPIAMIGESASGDRGWTVTLVARRPVVGNIHDANLHFTPVALQRSDWQCADLCSVSIRLAGLEAPLHVMFVPRDHGPANLLQTFFESRWGRYSLARVGGSSGR